MAQRTLWGVGSARAFRVHWVLHELKLDYKTQFIRTRTATMDTPVFKKVSPRKKIPVFEDGNLKLFESCAIVKYIAEKYNNRETSLLPEGPIGRARCDEWCFFSAMELDATTLYVIRRHGDLPEIYGKSPVAVDSAVEYFSRQIMVAEIEIKDGRDYLLGTQFTIADIILTSCLNMAIGFNCSLPDRLRTYRARMMARPAYKNAFAVCYPKA